VRRQVVACFVVVGSMLAVPARAEQWSKTYKVLAKPELTVSAGDGQVVIDTWNEPRIEARIEWTGYVLGQEFKLSENLSKNHVTIETKFPSISVGVHAGDDRSLKLILKVPRDTSLEVRTDDAPMRITGVHGDVRLHSIDGRIDASDLDGQLTVSSREGKVAVEGRFDGLDLQTSDGAIEAAVRPGSRIRSPWNIRAADGAVTLRLPADLKAEFDARSGDGRLTVNLPLARTGTASDSHVHGTFNGGSGQLSVRTANGPIRVDPY
jgi:DUF4097 and DUF4098 domain-containing protein YvlB